MKVLRKIRSIEKFLEEITGFGDDNSSKELRLIEAQALLFNDLTPWFKKKLLENKNANYVLQASGRGTGKTSDGAKYFLYLTCDERYQNSYALAFRQMMVSISSSTYAVLCSIIRRLKLQDVFYITKKEIVNVLTNVTIIFSGMKNLENIKSNDRMVLLWGEEMAGVKYDDLSILMPTLRGLPSELKRVIFNLNPYSVVEPACDYIRRNEGNYIENYMHIQTIHDEYDHKYLDSILWKEYQLDLKFRSSEEVNWIWGGQPSPEQSLTPFLNIQAFSDDDFDKLKIKQSVAYLDPSYLGGDYSALTILHVSECGKYVVRGYAWKRSHEQLVITINEILERYGISTLIHEGNGIWNTIRNNFIQAGIKLNVGYISHSEPKFQRIARVYGSQNIMKNIFFINNQENFVYNKIMKEYNVEDCKKHKGVDDAPDSLEGAFFALNKYNDRVQILSV